LGSARAASKRAHKKYKRSEEEEEGRWQQRPT
jgi:hypothetical protein